MTSKTWMIALTSLAIASIAAAADFGGHVGYFGNDVRKADLGIHAMFPIGMIAIAPNIDYTRTDGAGLWFGNADVDLRFRTSRGPTFWIGAGPTYGYLSNYGSTNGTRGYQAPSRAAQQYTPPPPPTTNPPPPTSGNPPGYVPPGNNPPGNPPTGNPLILPPGARAFQLMGGSREWGWDANAGVAFNVASVQPYVMVRYNKVHSLKTTGLVVGLQFGH